MAATQNEGFSPISLAGDPPSIMNDPSSPGLRACIIPHHYTRSKTTSGAQYLSRIGESPVTYWLPCRGGSYTKRCCQCNPLRVWHSLTAAMADPIVLFGFWTTFCARAHARARHTTPTIMYAPKPQIGRLGYELRNCLVFRFCDGCAGVILLRPGKSAHYQYRALGQKTARFSGPLEEWARDQYLTRHFHARAKATKTSRPRAGAGKRRRRTASRCS